MKCDELKPLVFSLNDLAYIDELMVQPNFQNPHDHAVYKATEVDAAISELKQKLSEKDKEIAELKKKLMPCLNGDCILTCEVVEKYGKENAELKAEIESLKASHYAEMVDAGMRERRLCRLLWLARAERAVTEQTIDEWSRYKEKHPLGSWRVDPFDYWVNAWINVEKLCRKKAEQYK